MPTKHILSLPPIEELLTEGGDSRIMLNQQGLNKYGCTPIPQSELLSYSSSTASIISPAAFAASAKLHQELQNASHGEAATITYARKAQNIRDELIKLSNLSSLPGLEIILGASGTDLHLFTAQLFRQLDPSLLIIMPQASETGSGVKAALKGRHFSTQTAFGGAVISDKLISGEHDIDVISVDYRLPDGKLRPESSVDAEIEALVVQAVTAGRRVLLTLIDVSKTGLIVPSPGYALALKQRFPALLDILVDACQFRLANSTLRSYLKHEFLVAITGSKFVTGPAFCGALLVPGTLAERLRNCPLPRALSAYSTRADWPLAWAACSSLNDSANYGLLLRFKAALAEMRAFHSIPEKLIAPFLKTFAAAVQKRLGDDAVFEPLAIHGINRKPLAGNDNWDHIPTIFPFLLRHKSGLLFNHDEIVKIYELMKTDLSNHPDIPAPMRQLAAKSCLLGQPVTYGIQNGIPTSALRLSLDMHLIVYALSPEGRGADAIITEAILVLDKAAMLVKYLFT